MIARKFALAGRPATGDAQMALAETLDALEPPPAKGLPDVLSWLAQSGLYSHVVTPKPSVLDLCLVRLWLGYHSPAADAIYAVQGLCANALARVAPKNPWLDRLRCGQSVGAFALTEPGAGSDVAALTTVASTTGEEVLITGTKTFISNAPVAEVAVVFAKTVVDDKRSICTALVPLKQDGVTIEPIDVGSDHPLALVKFNGAKAEILGQHGSGYKNALSTLGLFRTSVGAAAMGMSRRALDETLGHVTKREQFGATLSSLETVQNKLAEMQRDIASGTALVWQAAWQLDHGVDHAQTAVAIAKWSATELGQQVVDSAVQLHGGLGVTSDVVVSHLYRDIRPLRIYEGATEIQKRIVARALLKGWERE